MQNLPEETVFDNLEEGLDILRRERAVIHTLSGMLKGYFQSNPFHHQNLKIFGKGKAKFYSIIVPFNSPLKPILQVATNTFIESGTMDFMLKAWEGKEIPQNSAAEIMILTVGQVILVFVIVFMTFSLSLVVFLCELCHKQIKERRLQIKLEKAKLGMGKKRHMKIPNELLRYPSHSKWDGPVRSKGNSNPAYFLIKEQQRKQELKSYHLNTKSPTSPHSPPQNVTWY